MVPGVVVNLRVRSIDVTAAATVVRLCLGQKALFDIHSVSIGNAAPPAERMLDATRRVAIVVLG